MVTSCIDRSFSQPQLVASLYTPPPYLWCKGETVATELTQVTRWEDLTPLQEGDPLPRKNIEDIKARFHCGVRVVNGVLVFGPESWETQEKLFLLWLGRKCSKSRLKRFPKEIFAEINKFLDCDFKVPKYLTYVK